MNVTLWGTRGSLAAPGGETARYGGNTSCVEVRGQDGTVVVLDAGSGIRRLGASLEAPPQRIDILLTHLHMDHIQGLGFFAPLHQPGVEAHIWGPAGLTLGLRARLMRYLSPPLFPVRLRDLACRVKLHEVPCGDFRIGSLDVSADYVCHPGPTVAYRIREGTATMAYVPDHEPGLGARTLLPALEWTSGGEIMRGVDLLIHDAQYAPEEYSDHVGWGHSSISHTLHVARLAGVRRLVLFHHDPAHTDRDLDLLVEEAARQAGGSFTVVGGAEGATFRVE